MLRRREEKESRVDRSPNNTKVLISTSYCQRRYQQHKAGGFTIVGRTEIIDMVGEDFEGKSQGGLLKWDKHAANTLSRSKQQQS